jgi:hypothetical protein
MPAGAATLHERCPRAVAPVSFGGFLGPNVNNS